MTGKVLPLSANVVSLLVLVWKTAYDLWWNPKKFHESLASGVEPIKAAREKKERSDSSTLVVFFFLAVASLLAILGDLYE